MPCHTFPVEETHNVFTQGRGTGHKGRIHLSVISFTMIVLTGTECAVATKKSFGMKPLVYSLVTPIVSSTTSMAIPKKTKKR